MEAELGECGVGPDEVEEVLGVLGQASCGIEEARLSASLRRADELALSWVLDALEPALIRAGGTLLVPAPVLAAIAARYRPWRCTPPGRRQDEGVADSSRLNMFRPLSRPCCRLSGKDAVPARPYSDLDFAAAADGSGARVHSDNRLGGDGAGAAHPVPRLLYFETSVAESLHNLQVALRARPAEAEAFLQSVALFRAVRHADCYAWYIECWRAYAASAAGGRIRPTSPATAAIVMR